MERKLWKVLTTGSHLYGTATPESDQDYVKLYLPTPWEMIANRQVRLPQVIHGGVDTRHVLLGEFVAGLGTNPEWMIIAVQYRNIFGEIEQAWLNGRALHNILNAAESMWNNAKTAKNRAHAYRYAVAVNDICRGRETLYPMLQGDHERYMEIRTGVDSHDEYTKSFDYLRMHVNRKWPSDQEPDHQRLAEWVLVRYLGIRS